MEYKIYSEITSIKKEYETEKISILPGLLHSQYGVLKMCEFYSNSRYLRTTGNKDAMGRDTPFYNIVNFRVTLAKVATDMDVKDVQVASDDPKHFVESMFLNHEAYEWMKKTNFALTLNRLGQKRPKYGGVIVKKVMTDGELSIDVVDWRNVYTDQIDILNNPIMECHYMTPVDLTKKMKVWDETAIKDAIKAFKKQPKKSGNIGKKEVEANRIEVYEIHGQFPVSMLKEAQGEDYEDEDEYTYSDQVYYIGDVGGKCFMFFSDTEKESPYDYLPWEEMEGRALGRGVIEDAEEAQVWTNDSVMNEKNAMDLAGKVVAKTTSKKLANNMLEVDNGKIFELEEGKDMSILNLTPSSLGEYQNQINKWREQVDRATSSFDANTGEQPPSGTPYAQTALLNQVASKPFDYRREEQGIFITRIFEKWILPYLIDKLYKKHILVSDYSPEELEFIDNRFAEKEVREHTINSLLKGEIVTPEQQAQMKDSIVSNMQQNKAKRFITIPEGFFDDVEAKVTVITTNEQRNKGAVLSSLASLLETAMKTYNPQTGQFAIFQNKALSDIYNTIMEISGTGLSPIAFGMQKGNAAPSAPATMPAQGGAPSPLPANAPAPATLA